MLTLGEEPLSIPLQALSTGKGTLWRYISNVQAHKVQYFCHCLCPGPQPWELRDLGRMSFRRCTPKYGSKDSLVESLWSGTGTATAVHLWLPIGVTVSAQAAAQHLCGRSQSLHCYCQTCASHECTNSPLRCTTAHPNLILLFLY